MMSKFKITHLPYMGYERENDGKFVPTRYTFHYRQVGDYIEYSFACCSHTDQFKKKIGNEVVRKNIEDGKVYRFKPDPEVFDGFTRSEVMMHIFCDIEANHLDKLPQKHRTMIERNSPSASVNAAHARAEMIDALGGLMRLLNSDDDEECTCGNPECPANPNNPTNQKPTIH